jgi:poly(3-hydroxybutyrate) depolymerase
MVPCVVRAAAGILSPFAAVSLASTLAWPAGSASLPQQARSAPSPSHLIEESARHEASPAFISLIQHYLNAPTYEDAELMLVTILQDSRADLKTVGAALAAGQPYAMEPTGTYLHQPVRVGDRTHHFGLHVPESYLPFKDYALVVCLHGAGFTGDAYLERWQARLGEGYILACPTLMSGAWWTREAEELVIATISLVQTRYRIDPDRVFLTGMSNGAIGAYLIGAHHAPRFAGIAPMAGGLDDVLLPLLANLARTPVYIIHGAHDQVMPVQLSRTIAGELRRLGIPHVYREHTRVHPQAGGHFFPREEVPDLVAWFDRTRRTPVPARVTVVRDASHLVPFGWVRIDATDRIVSFTDRLLDVRDEALANRLYAKADARVASPNRIEVRTDRVRRYTLFLNDALVDFSKPVTVVTNGRVSYEGPVSPSVETLLRDARRRQERRPLFPVALSIDVGERP